MKSEDLKLFLQDITFNSEYKFLEVGKDDKEIEDITKRHKIDVGNDLAILKIEYAYTDRFNKNGCRLPKDEVIKALGSIKGRILDEDHLRKAVRGFMIEGKVEDKTIIAYAAFFKSSFPDRYELLKQMISEKQLAVSFEAYGKRNFVNAHQYDLVDISFAGCGLLYTTKPAFEGARVLEAAKVTDQVLEFANEFKSPDDLLHLERARYHMHDINTINKMLNEASCPHCQTMSPYTVDEINFKGNTAQATCWDCQNPYDINLTPQTTPAMQSAKKDSSEEDDNKDKKNKSKTEDSKDMEEITKLQTELASKIQELEKALASIETLKTELETAKTSLTKATEEFEKAKTDLTEKLTKEKDEAIKTAGEKAVKLASRKAELADFAKDMKDEDILDETKYENAKLKKENAELKKKGPITANVNTEETLEVGSKITEADATVFTTQDNIKNLAFKITK